MQEIEGLLGNTQVIESASTCEHPHLPHLPIKKWEKEIKSPKPLCCPMGKKNSGKRKTKGGPEGNQVEHLWG
jgi:hypothetical protein